MRLDVEHRTTVVAAVDEEGSEFNVGMGLMEIEHDDEEHSISDHDQGPNYVGEAFSTSDSKSNGAHNSQSNCSSLQR